MSMKFINQIQIMPILWCAAALFVSSCANNQVVVESEESTDIKNGLIVRDFIVAISQVHDPASSTIQLNKPGTRFGQELESGFRELGYGMQRVTFDQGELFLSYSINSNENSSNVTTTTYNISVGDVAFERGYAEKTGGGIAPIGPMVVYGTDKAILLNNELFPGQSIEVEYAENDNVGINEGAITIIDASVMDAISKLRQDDLPIYKSLNSQNQEIENLFSRGSSNFESVDESYRTVRKDTIIFDDDSLVLKAKGREQISKLIDFYDLNTDVFRLIGCSIGPTKIDGGNEQLAMGRSKRVAQELVSREVSLEAIFDEGCWSPSAGGSEVEYPARAVVIELQRKG